VQDVQKYKNNKVVKSNQINEARVKLDLYEQRIVLFLVSLIDSMKDTNFKKCVIEVKKFMELIGVQDKGTYSRLRKITKNLRDKSVEIEMPNGDFLQVGWIDSVLYKTKKGIIEISISEEMKPFLLQLKNHFTLYKLKNILFLRSVFSIRLYELLKQHERLNNGVVEFEINKLKWLLNINENQYKRYNDFKRKTLLKAQNELKDKTDVWFEFEEIKKCRKIIAIKFIVYSKKGDGKQKEIEQDSLPATHKQQLSKNYKDKEQTEEKRLNISSDLYNELITHGVQPPQIEVFLNNPEIGEQGIQEGFDYYKKNLDAGKIHTNKQAYLIQSISMKWGARTQEQKELDEKQKRNLEILGKVERWKEIVKLQRQEKYPTELKDLEKDIELFYKESKRPNYELWRHFV